MSQQPEASNYLKKIQELWDEGQIPPGTFTNVRILHDNWCGLLNGRTVCNCNPDIKIEKPL
jgi:hypothetical protein